jgi:hypothetical protein
MTYLTRKDEGVGEGLFDSVKWALETHVQIPDECIYNFALLYGNEDAPSKIEFWRNEPHMLAPDYKEHTPADYVWEDIPA